MRSPIEESGQDAYAKLQKRLEELKEYEEPPKGGELKEGSAHSEEVKALFEKYKKRMDDLEEDEKAHEKKKTTKK